MPLNHSLGEAGLSESSRLIPQTFMKLLIIPSIIGTPKRVSIYFETC